MSPSQAHLCHHVKVADIRLPGLVDSNEIAGGQCDALDVIPEGNEIKVTANVALATQGYANKGNDKPRKSIPEVRPASFIEKSVTLRLEGVVGRGGVRWSGVDWSS